MIYLVDISRLVENLHLTTPTGIDRVEMAYAQHFLARAERDDVRFVVTWPNFSGVLKPRDVRSAIEETARRWTAGTRPDKSFQALQELRNEPIEFGRQRPLRIGSPDDRRRLADWVRVASIWLRSAAHRLNARSVTEFRDKDVCYIHVSQFRLNRPERFAWLSAASIPSVFMLHDLIPITHPEYCRAGESGRHRVRVDTMLKHATRIVAVSDATRRALKTYAKNEKLGAPPCQVVPLGLASIFTDCKDIEPLNGAVPYFVVVGTIEPRKNLLHLLTIWHRWTEEGRNPRARLIVVGRRGWENENILELLDRSKGLAPSVVEVASLGDRGMVSLLKGARALLAPSFVEGYGLPIAEALSLGTPVIASDTEAHREAGGSLAQYLDPLDGTGWIRAFDRHLMADSKPKDTSALNMCTVNKWDDHLRLIDQMLDSKERTKS